VTDDERIIYDRTLDAVEYDDADVESEGDVPAEGIVDPVTLDGCDYEGPLLHYISVDDPAIKPKQ
jgi:hypothetical protein